MPTAELPQYGQIKRRLIEEIRSGKWQVGGPFPSEAELVSQYKVSRSTLVRSLQELVREGYLYRRQGQGTVVADYRHRQPNTAPLPLFFHGNAPLSGGRASYVLLRILAGIEAALGPGLPGLMIRQVAQGPLDEETRRLIHSLKPAAALVIEPSFSPELLAELRRIECVVWSLNEPLDDANCVYIDQERAGYLATKFLIDEGRRRIALLNGPADAYWGFAAKRRGYGRALMEAGIPVDERLIRAGQHPIDSEAGRMLLRELLNAGFEPDGVVAASDYKAMGAVALAREMGLAVPAALRIVGMDNTVAAESDPPLPSVVMPFEEVGRQAALRAKEAIDQRGSSDAVVSVQQIRLQPTLEPRK